MNQRLWAFCLVACCALALVGCSSANTLFVKPPIVSSDYKGKSISGGSLAVVMLPETLVIGGDRGGVRVVGAHDFYEFFVQSLADSIRVRGGFDSVDVFGPDALPTAERTLRVSSTSSEIFTVPDATQAIELDASKPDFVLVVSALHTNAVGPRPNGSGIGGMGMGPPTASGGARYVIWDNWASRPVSWTEFNHYVVPGVEFRNPDAWHQLAAHMADLMIRKTPFDKG